MMVSNRSSFLGVLAWQWRYTLLFLVAGVLAWLIHDVWGLKWLVLPSVPATVIGAALGIFASFRANAAYARWWEGRQLWGKLVNASRMWASQCLAYVHDLKHATRLIERHALYVHVLRCQLRDDDPFADEHVQRLLPAAGYDDDDVKELRTQTSLCHRFIDDALQSLAERDDLDARRLQSLDGTLMTFLDVQGGCERIKRTPMPRAYAFFVTWLLIFFCVLLPLSLVDEMGWLTIPVNLVVCMGFTLISETGRVLEDPFTHFYNSLPITQISVNIERNMVQRLPARDGQPRPLPDAVVVDARGILW